MNKSKFLKKSLALLLSVMMVVAMIPLGASAAWDVSNGNDVVSITTNTGTIDKTSNTAGKVTLAWSVDDEADVTLTVRLARTVTKVTYAVDGEDQTPVEDITAGTPVTLTFKAGAKAVTFVPYKGETAGSTYTITVDKPAPSDDVTLKEATITVGENTINGVISGRNIVFTVPWGLSGSQTVTVTPNHPVDAESLPTASVEVGGTGTVSIASQSGAYTTVYNISINEAAGLSAVAVNGVAGTVSEEDDSVYAVVLPIGTEFVAGTTEMPVTFSISDLKSASWNGTAITTGKKAVVEASNTLLLTSKSDTTKTYTVSVSVKPNDQAKVESFTLSDSTFTAEGKVSGSNLTAELPYSANLATITANLTVSAGATVTAASGTVAQVEDGKYTISNLDLSDDKTVEVAVVSADDTNEYIYTLSATKADTRNNSNTVSSLKMTIGEDDYQGAISGTTITFTVPYGTKASDVAGATFTGAYPSGSSGTAAGATDGYSDNDLKTAVTFTVTSETGRMATYTIKFVKSGAKTGKTLSGVSFANAATSDAVKAENTYAATVSGKKMTVTFPHSAKTNKGNYATLVPTFTVSDGAKLYTSTGVEVKSGYYAEDDETVENRKQPKSTPITLTALDNEYVFIVADEAAVFEHEVKGTALTSDDLAKNITEITVEVKYAAPQTGNTLTGITEAAGHATGSVSGNTLTVTVPYSYCNNTVDFSVEWNASAMATLKSGAATLNEDTVLNVVADGTDADGNAVYALKIKDGAKISSIVVENEAQNNTRTYDVVVKVNPVETGALVTSAKANDTVAAISNTSWTITATVPATTDLTAVKLSLTASTMATLAVLNNDGTPATVVQDNEGQDIADTYDVSDADAPLLIKVTAEDGSTINVYTLVVTPKEIKFDDVKEGTWYYEYVYAAANAGIVNGKSETVFDPSSNVTRAQFALMVVRMLGKTDEAAKYVTTPFTDVPSTSGAAGAIAYCAEKGIINGVGNNRFAPNSSITREQAAKIVAIALGISGSSTTKFADDASIAGWAKTYVDACSTAGLIDGIGGNKFNPKGTLTRAQAAKILVLALDQK